MRYELNCRQPLNFCIFSFISKVSFIFYEYANYIFYISNTQFQVLCLRINLVQGLVLLGNKQLQFE